MATSTTTMSAVPTVCGAISLSFFPNFIQNYWWLRSPDRTTNVMNQREFCVTQSGTISSGGMYGSNITDSYGTISPNMNHTNETINAFRISSSGDIDGRNWIFTTGSYGIW